MDKKIYIMNLYDYYYKLLTDKQQEYFEDYYFNNLTLAEISENYDISRNAVHKQIKEVEERLIYYETNLNLYSKYKKIEEIINIDENIKKQILEILEWKGCKYVWKNSFYKW